MSMENKTFDLRQILLVNSGYKKPNKDIVLIVVDDASYEYLLEKYGEWPPPRDMYAKLIDHLEKQKPSVIAFDLMFIKSLKSKSNADAQLVEAMKKNNNVFTSMNFDNQTSEVRTPIDLDKKFTVQVKNDSKIDFFNKDLSFSNCRAILPQILANTQNVGMINISRADDGILRKMPPFVTYKGDYYPHLALLVGLNYLKQTENLHLKDFYVDKNSNLHIGERKMPIDEDGSTIMNWYGPAGTFQQIPLYKIIKTINKEGSYNFDLKDKIIYVGVTAVSLYDTKSIPVSKLYPGVELHATYVNNLIDNNFIRKVNPEINAIISLLLGLFIGIMVIRTSSTFIALGTTILTASGYIILAYYLMKFCNLWISIVFPITSIFIIFVSAYIIKYILKSRDFEYQYKLATTDGLTDLYNHRYFQEQMILQVANSKRYNTYFSLILIDIDFFKKFNDIYGHQSGDAVLRQVALKLRKNVRSTDIACRYGGEEMSIILPNSSKEEAIITAQKICQAIAETPFKLANDKESPVTISLGVASYPQDGETSTALIAKADKCLYEAKENGRNQVRY